MAWTLTNVTTGVDLSAGVEAPSLQVVQRAYADISRMSFRYRDESGSVSIATDHELLLADGAVKVFAGFAKVVKKADTGVSSQRVYDIQCQDYTPLLAADYAPAGTIRSTVESDKARITWLFSTFGTRGIAIGASVVQLRATMPSAQDFSGMTLHQCLTAIAAVTGGSFYVDYDKVLHYYSSEVNAAPFNLSDNPNGSTTFGFEAFAESSDTVEFLNEVHVIYAGGSTTRYLGGSPPAAGTRQATVLTDLSIPDLATAQARGDAMLGTYGVIEKPSSLTTYKPGLKAGQTVQVTHAGWGISAVTYRIAGLEARPETKDRIAYTIDFGSGVAELGSFASAAHGSIVAAGAVAQQAAAGVTAIADLSVGGANLVPNSSFEDGSAWAVGANWAIGLTPGGGQLPFHGLDVARAALAAQTAGDLVTAKIAVDRNDEYSISFWRFVRSRTSGTFRAFVKEYNAANTLLATTNVDIVAADTAWSRTILRFAPAVALVPAKIAWQPTTAKVEIGFNSAGAAATMTVDVDGVQLERGEAPTAYAPSPGEILAGTIGTTQIADDAVTTPKLIASAVTAAKIAAGTITGDRIVAGTITSNLLAAGAITLYDENGSTLLTPGGFAGAWFDFISLGLYNARLLQGTVGAIPDGRTAALPYWTAATASGAGTALAYLSGGGVKATWSAGTSSRYITSDPIPVIGGEAFEAFLTYAMTRAGPAGSLSMPVSVLWRDAAGTLISTDSVNGFTASEWATTARTTSPKAIVLAPDSAVTAEFRVQFSETTHTAGNDITLYGASLRRIGSAEPPEQRYDFQTMPTLNPGSGTVNDYAGIDRETAVAVLNPSADLVLTGIVAPRVNLRRLRLMNSGSFKITLTNEDAGSTAANRFRLPGGGTIELNDDEVVELIYRKDGSPANRWTAVVAERTVRQETGTLTGGGTATFSTNEFEYIRMGNLVFFRIAFTVNAAGSGAVAVSLSSTGIPAPKSNFRVVGDRGATGVNAVIARMIASGGELQIASMSLVATPTTLLTGADLAAGAVYSFHGSFIAA